MEIELEIDPASTDETKAFLEELGRDRYWLARMTAYKKPSLDNYFGAEKFPDPLGMSIARLIKQYRLESKPSDSQGMNFTYDEWDEIYKDMNRTTAGSFKEYLKAVLKDRAETERSDNYPDPTTEPALVAEPEEAK